MKWWNDEMMKCPHGRRHSNIFFWLLWHYMRAGGHTFEDPLSFPLILIHHFFFIIIPERLWISQNWSRWIRSKTICQRIPPTLAYRYTQPMLCTLKYQIIDSHGIKDAVGKFTPIPKRCTWNKRCTWPVGKLTIKDAHEWIKDAPDQ